MDDADLEEAVHERIADILLVFSDAASGDFSTSVPTDLPEDHPAGALVRVANELIATLSDAHERHKRYQAELEQKLALVETQQLAIRELSTPIMEVWDGVLCLPVVGVMDTHRSSEMTERILEAVVRQQARYVIIDITGIEVMDTRTADHFVRMTRAVQLLGAECVLSGINPNIAQTIVHMGLDLGSVMTRRDLRDALQHYVQHRQEG